MLLHGQVIPADSILVMARRPPTGMSRSGGFGPNFWLGANLALLKTRIALETILARIPEWTVDKERSKLTGGIDTCGWARLPVDIP